MKAGLLSLLTLGGLCGCASGNLYTGPALPTCSGPGMAASFASGACRSGAEYDTARKKAMHSLGEARSREDKD